MKKMESNPRLTDERLKTWLDANQLARERLCQAILSIDKHFSDVHPRHPRGGPDGGRDLEAKFNNEYLAWGAIGFQNSVSDSASYRTQAQKKFKEDLEHTLKKLPSLKVFVFFTNVNLTVTEKESLVIKSKRKGIEYCEIFDRERMRIVLDSPDGLSIRYQYLQIPLSDAEQASFFARWGDDLQFLIARSFKALDEGLKRIQFYQEANRPLRSIMFIIKLSQPLLKEDIPHFRAVLNIMTMSLKKPYKELNIASCNNFERSTISTGGKSNEGIAGAFWREDESKPLQTSKSIRPEPLHSVLGGGGYSEFDIQERIPLLLDLDESFFVFFVNRKLSEYVDKIKIYANEYLLWSASRSELNFSAHDHNPNCPWFFTEEELNDAWVRIMPVSGVGVFRFSDIIPCRIFDPIILISQ